MTTSRRWLPIGFRFTPTAASVRWMAFGSQRICEPFFHQTLVKLRSMKPAAPERYTHLSTLIDVAKELGPAAPSGLIFHVSRCGSTLLSNALREGRDDVLALSEARPIGMLFRPQGFRNSPFPLEDLDIMRELLVNAVTSVYAHRSIERKAKIIIKTYAANMLHIPLFRSVWPDIPSVIVIRDPVEVMISNLAKPAAWAAAFKNPIVAARVFGWNAEDVHAMSAEEYCARGIGKFCESASAHVDANCKVLDYAELNIDRVCQIAKWFDIEMPPERLDILVKLFGVYAKDITSERRFVNDREWKQAKANGTIRQAAERWAYMPYKSLKAMGAW